MLSQIPKPVVIGAVAVIVVLSLVIIFKSIKHAGGDGDYDAAELKKADAARSGKANAGRTMPTKIAAPTGGAHAGMSSSSAGYPSSGGH